MSLRTSAWDFPQKLHIVMFVGRAISIYDFKLTFTISKPHAKPRWSGGD
jgi:hypothetical protein